MAGGQTVGELGEFGLIAAVAGRLAPSDPGVVPVGIGDDSAVIAATGSDTVACTDLLVQDVHFRLDWSSGADVGRKAAAQNLADIVAMGATPQSLLMGLCLPADTEVDWVLDLADGMSQEAARAGATVVGGDIVRGDQIVVSVTALGHMDGRIPVRRSGARAHDIVAYTGRLGRSAAGLMLLQRGFRSPRVLVNAHRAPEPDYAGALEATRATAMIDVSDGLVSDLGHIARASHVAIHIDSQALEVDEDVAAAASAFTMDPLPWLLHGGEDHAFVATFPDALAVPTHWIIIGRVVAGPPAVWVDGREVPPGGWDHFAHN